MDGQRAGLRLVVAVLLAGAGACGPARAQEGGPAFLWRTDLEAAMAEARATGKSLWLQFTGPWCGFCRRMESEVFPAQPVASLVRERFIPVQVRSDVRDDLVARFGVGILPTSVVMRPDGTVVARRQGFAPVANFVAFLRGSEVGAPSEPALEAAPVDEAPAVEGLCVVSLVDGKGRVVGDPAWRALHEGRVYHFADVGARDRFVAEPGRYAPVGGGVDAVTGTRPGSVDFGVYYGGRLYLCGDEAARREFAAEPERYVAGVPAAGGFCPHCRPELGPPAPGRVQFPLFYGGRRYLFPDESHREAFRLDPGKFLR
jgi:YHS domain-containing protein